MTTPLPSIGHSVHHRRRQFGVSLAPSYFPLFPFLSHSFSSLDSFSFFDCPPPSFALSILAPDLVRARASPSPPPKQIPRRPAPSSLPGEKEIRIPAATRSARISTRSRQDACEPEVRPLQAMGRREDGRRGQDRPDGRLQGHGGGDVTPARRYDKNPWPQMGWSVLTHRHRHGAPP